MNWQDFTLELPQARLALSTRGEGERILLCLHAYLQRKESFYPLFDHVPAGWRVITLDLPPFGASQWLDETRWLDHDFFQALWNALHQRFPAARWHLLGFSMGGKVSMALQLAVRSPARDLILIAPDGIRSNLWHRLIRSSLGQRLHRWLDRHPQWLLRPVHWLYRLGWLDATSYRISSRTYESATGRQQLALQIQLYSHLQTPLAQMRTISLQHQIRTHLIWGKNDRVLPPAIAKRWVRKVPHSSLHLLDGGHMLLREKTDELRQLIWQLLS